MKNDLTGISLRKEVKFEEQFRTEIIDHTNFMNNSIYTHVV